MGYTFISYSTKNQQMADSFRELFNRNGIDTWMAPGDIPFGSTYTSTINRAIKGAACFTILLSGSAQVSPWVLKETERAVSTGKTIFTVLLDDVPMNDDFEFMLSTTQAIAIRKINENNSDIQKLLKAVRAYTGEKNHTSRKQNSHSVHTSTIKKSTDTSKSQVSGDEDPVALNQKSKQPFSRNCFSSDTGILGCKVGDTIRFGKYAQTSLGRDRTPIEWKVLAIKNGKALLLSKFILDFKQFNNKRTLVEWENCSLRKWINGSFFNRALDDSEKALIESAQKERQTNKDDQKDKFFLLSYDDVQNRRYGFVAKIGSDSTRRAQGTEYALAICPDSNVFTSWWILTDKKRAGRVDENGGLYSGTRETCYHGIRPACWIDVYMAEGLCRHCGGSFNGFTKKTCSKCGREKDY